MIQIEKASVQDAKRIAELARNIYREYYLHLWDTDGAEWYMYTRAYATARIEQELVDPNVEYYIATESTVDMGYLKLLLDSTLTGYETVPALEIERIYMYKKYSGKGIGKLLMQLSLQRATDLQKEIIFLKAMDSSLKAIEFYKKLGYTVCAKISLPMPDFFRMKPEYRGMLILKKKVLIL